MSRHLYRYKSCCYWKFGGAPRHQLNGGDTLGVGITLNGVGILAHGGTIIGDTTYAFYANNSVVATNNGAVKIQGGLDANNPYTKAGLIIENSSVVITQGAIIVESGISTPNAEILGGILTVGLLLKNSAISIQEGFLEIFGGYTPVDAPSSKLGIILNGGDTGIYVHGGTLVPGYGDKHFALMASDSGVSSYIYLNDGGTIIK